MSAALFVYGPLCHAPLRTAVLGLGHSVAEARVPGFRRRPGRGRGDGPGVEAARGAELAGLVVRGIDDKAWARAAYFAEVVGCRPLEVKARTGRLGAVRARAFVPEGTAGGSADGAGAGRERGQGAGDVTRAAEAAGAAEETGAGAPESGAGWDLASWSDAVGPIWVEAAREAMAGLGQVPAEEMARRWGTMCMRAASRQRAAQSQPATAIRADLTATRDVEILTPRRPYTGFFSLEDPDLRFRRFDGSWSERVQRAAFVGGDAVTVLPYDPVLDSVLVVEQFRAGALARGDPAPWTLEPVAGRIDPGETPEDSARREAREEAGLALGPLHQIAAYYPSPGAVTEYLFSYVAEADLAGQGGVIGGEAAEHEDIRTHVVPVEQLMALIASGEAGTGPLVLSAYWLVLNRLRLWG